MHESLFLRACRRQPVPRHPVWMMRQAGRYLPEYRAIRSKVDFLTLCRTPELAAEVTLQPIDILGVDAAVIFSDILVIPDALGLGVVFEAGDGPRLERTIASDADVTGLDAVGLTDKLAYVYEAIRRVATALTPRGVPVLGFAGAPFTLACYCVEGTTSREFHRTRKLLRTQPAVFARLLDRLAESTAEHLVAQVKAGAAAVQIFDTWAGVLSRDDYRTLILPSLRSLVTEVKRTGVPVIAYANGAPVHLESLRDTGADVVSVDWRLPLSEVRRRLGADTALQGNLDPTELYAAPDVIRARVHAMLTDNAGGPLVANLGHGILPDVPVDHARAFVNAVKEFAL